MSDEDISEWQEISYPSSTTTNNNNNNTQIAAVEITTLPFPEISYPSSTTTNNNNNTQIAAVEITTLPLTEDVTTYDNNSNDERGSDGNKWLKKSLRELRCWIVQIGSKMRNYATSKVGIGKIKCNTSGILALFLVFLFYLIIQKKWRRQKQVDGTSNKLLLLLQEKDQQIKQLSLQISQMNECLLTRRKVPVLQVG